MRRIKRVGRLFIVEKQCDIIITCINTGKKKHGKALWTPIDDTGKVIDENTVYELIDAGYHGYCFCRIYD